jgi:hypothetical protein
MMMRLGDRVAARATTPTHPQTFRVVRGFTKGSV